MSILVYRPDNPRRSPDWRWQRAGELAQGDRIFKGRDDRFVRAACKFRKQLARCETDAQMLALHDACPAMFTAHAVYAATDGGEEPRWELEARLLAREDFETVGAKLGLTPETIAVYEHMFFDVISRLTSPSIITHTVIGSAVQAGLAEREHDCLWKLFGYWAGPAVLDAYIFKFNAPCIADGPAGVRAFVRDHTKEQMDMKACISIMTMPVTWQTRVEILQIWKDMLAMELQAGAAASGAEMLNENINAMLQSFQWQKHQPDVDGPIAGVAGELEQKGVRLRAVELAMIGIGEKPRGLEHLISEVRFPDEGNSDEDNA